MNRQYEDPRKVEQMLAEAQRELEMAKRDDDNIDRIIDLYNWVEELRERANFAWQDDEYDEMEAMA